VFTTADITGETPWMKNMIEAYGETARQSGARIVHACGFDSIPSDLGCLMLQDAARERFGQPCREVKMAVRASKGGFSGGTIASMLETIKAVEKDPSVGRVLDDPYALNPSDERGHDGADQRSLEWDEDWGWTGPFVMARINTRVVRRSNMLLDYAYGRDFSYSEVVAFGKSRKGWLMGGAMTASLGMFATGMIFAPTRELLMRFVLPKPGQGPSPEQQRSGFFSIELIGRSAAGETLRAKVGAHGDAYSQTAKMVSEAALAMVFDGDRLPQRAGALTPASALGQPLIERLRAANMTFDVA
jgi:short subunit dehydrogenase-like uncharacterized protein